MKRFLACILALLLALGCCAAGAETAKVTVSDIDIGQLIQIISGMDPEMQGEQPQQLFSILQAMLSKISFVGLVNETTMRFDLVANGTKIGSVTEQIMGDRITLASDLFPNCAIEFTADELLALQQSGAGDLSAAVAVIGGADGPTGITVNGGAQEVTQEQAAQLIESVGALITGSIGDAVPGEYTFEGESFTHRLPVRITLADVLEAARQGMALAGTDMSETIAQVPEEVLNTPYEGAIYLNLNEAGEPESSCYVEIGFSSQELGRSLFENILYTPERFHGTFCMGPVDLTSADAVMSAASTGSSADAVAVDVMGTSQILSAMLDPEAEQPETCQLTIGGYSQGMYLGLGVNGTGSSPVKLDVALYAPVPGTKILGCAVTAEGNVQEDLKGIPDGLIPLTLTELQDETNMIAQSTLMADIQQYGMVNWMTNLSAAMPEEINALIALIGTVSETAPAVPET